MKLSLIIFGIILNKKYICSGIYTTLQLNIWKIKNHPGRNNLK